MARLRAVVVIHAPGFGGRPVDGQDGLEGYYHQYDHPLELDQRLVFARHLEAPLFDAKTAPALPVASWPKPRLEKAYRNYAMEYVRTAAPVITIIERELPQFGTGLA